MAGPGGIITLTETDDHFPDPGDNNSGSETIHCLGGNDSVLAGLGNDTVYGGLGDDDLLGDQGDDFLDGGDGFDVLQGGDGNDVLYDLGGALCQIDAGTGRDFIQIGGGFGTLSTINGGAGYDILASGSTALNLITLAGIEELQTYGATMQATADQFAGFRRILSSGEGPDAGVSLELFGVRGVGYVLDLTAQLQNRSVTMFGSLGHDSLTTGRGDDQIWGDLGNDLLNGGRGRDDLHGSAGQDTLVGGLGRDVLTAGGGADVFRFLTTSDSPAQGRADRIIGFVPGTDRIDLAGVDAIAGGGDDAFTFIGGEGFHGQAGELRVETAGGRTLVQADVNGDGAADFHLDLAGGPALTAADFLL